MNLNNLNIRQMATQVKPNFTLKISKEIDSTKPTILTIGFKNFIVTQFVIEKDNQQTC